MNDKEEKGNHKSAYEKRNLPESIVIKGKELSYKDPPLKDNMFKYRCRRNKCNYFIKINEENIKKVLNNENIVTYEEFNKHTNQVNNINANLIKDIIFTDKQIEKQANDLIKANFMQPLDFHISNFERNKIKWKKSKIKKLFYSIKEEKFPKDEQLRENDDNFKSNFYLAKGEFINIDKKKKLERCAIFSSEFQLNFFSELK